MNRAERRKRGLKNNDPAVVVKRSDVNNLVNFPDVQKAIQEECHRVEKEEQQKAELDIDTLIIATLHSEFGFGVQRILRFMSGFIALHEYYRDKYEDSDMFALRMHLQKDGINVEEMIREVEKNAAEKSTNKG